MGRTQKPKKGQLANDSGGSNRNFDTILYMSKEDRDAFENNARDAAYRLSTVACKHGATTMAHDSELDPCGLDKVLDAVFGEEKSKLCRKKDIRDECA